jgi:murein L,D-transpeptidase YafK
MRCVLTYPIFGASGVSGPKLKEGDKQVPEGFYKITRFRPVVVAHLGLELNYPNEDDRKNAKMEKRHNLGGDILIHGSYWSTGCFAIGNEAIEDLFVLAYDTKIQNIKVVIAPCNLNAKKPNVDFKKQPPWVAKLYARLSPRLKTLPIPLDTYTNANITLK